MSLIATVTGNIWGNSEQHRNEKQRQTCRRGGDRQADTHSEQGSSSVRSDRYTLAKWMNSIPIACLEVSRNLGSERGRSVTLQHKEMAAFGFGFEGDSDNAVPAVDGCLHLQQTG